MDKLIKKVTENKDLPTDTKTDLLVKLIKFKKKVKDNTKK